MKIFDPNEALKPLTSKFSAPYWLHSSSKKTPAEFKKAKDCITKLIGLDPNDQLHLFMHKKTAAKKLFKSLLQQKIQESGKIHCLISRDLDPYIQEAIDELATNGCMKILLPTNEYGQIDIQKAKEHITFKSCFLSCSYCNPKTGIIEPVLELSKLCKDNDLLLHLDFDQAIGPHFFDFNTIGCDFLTLNCNTFFAPLGTTLLAIKKHSIETMPYEPMEAGVFLNTANALEEFHLQAKEGFLEIARQRRIFESRMAEELSVNILFKHTQRRANISLLQFDNCDHEALALFLRGQNILVGFDPDLDCICIQFSQNTSYEDFESLTTALIKSTKKLMQIGAVETSGV